MANWWDDKIVPIESPPQQQENWWDDKIVPLPAQPVQVAPPPQASTGGGLEALWTEQGQVVPVSPPPVVVSKPVSRNTPSQISSVFGMSTYAPVSEVQPEQVPVIAHTDQPVPELTLDAYRIMQQQAYERANIQAQQEWVNLTDAGWGELADAVWGEQAQVDDRTRALLGAPRTTMQAVRETLSDPRAFGRALPFVGDTLDQIADMAAAQRIADDQGTPADFERIADKIRFEQQPDNFGAGIVNTLAPMPGFMGEVMAGAPVYKAVAAPIAKGVFRTVGRHTGSKAASRLIGSAAGSAAQAALTTPIKVAGSAAEYRAPQLGFKEENPKATFGGQPSRIDFGTVKEGSPVMTALAKGLTDQTIELWSERVGEVINRLPGLSSLARAHTKLLGNYAAKYPDSKLASLITNSEEFLKKAQFQGPFVEQLEEEVGKVARWATRLDEEYKVTTPQEYAQQLIAFSVPGLPGHLAAGSQYLYDRSLDNVYQRAFERASTGAQQQTSRDYTVRTADNTERVVSIEDDAASGNKKVTIDGNTEFVGADTADETILNTKVPGAQVVRSPYTHAPDGRIIWATPLEQAMGVKVDDQESEQDIGGLKVKGWGITKHGRRLFVTQDARALPEETPDNQRRFLESVLASQSVTEQDRQMAEAGLQGDVTSAFNELRKNINYAGYSISFSDEANNKPQPLSGLIYLADPTDQSNLNHELFHQAAKFFLTGREYKTLQRQFRTKDGEFDEEGAAVAYQQIAADQQLVAEYARPWEKALINLRYQVRGFVGTLTGNKSFEQIAHEVRTGKAWDRGAVSVKEQEDRGAVAVPNYAQTREVDDQFRFRYAVRSNNQDADYKAAVERGDMETAQRMVNEAAQNRGYGQDDYRGNHRAPNREDAPVTNLTEIWPDDIYGPMAARYYGDGLPYDGLAISKLQALRNKKPTDRVLVFRAVPKDNKESKPRNGDWVTLTSEYAREHGKSHLSEGYRVQAYRAQVKDIYTDGNSIHEFGYDDGTNSVYSDTKNNQKLSAPVTYDDAGNVIPLSQRFDKRKADTRYAVANVDTPQFKRWFGRSKVVDANGKPLKVYHGVSNVGGNENIDFTVFDTPSFFTEDKSEGELYSRKGDKRFRGKLHEVYLNIKNPYELSDEIDDENRSELTEDPYDKWFVQEKINEGYDGFTGLRGGEVRWWIPFYPEQIKSADETTYDDQGKPIPQEQRHDQNNPDTRYAVSRGQNRNRILIAKQLGLKYSTSTGVVSNADGNNVGSFRDWGFDVSGTNDTEAAKNLSEKLGLNHSLLDGNYYTEDTSHPKPSVVKQGYEAMERVINEHTDIPKAMMHPLIGDITSVPTFLL